MVIILFYRLEPKFLFFFFFALLFYLNFYLSCDQSSVLLTIQAAASTDVQGYWLTKDVMLQACSKPRRAAMKVILVKEFVPRGPIHVGLRISRIWENKDQEQKVYKLGFIAVDQLVLSEH
jgi:hypothetical protein